MIQSYQLLQAYAYINCDRYIQSQSQSELDWMLVTEFQALTEGSVVCLV